MRNKFYEENYEDLKAEGLRCCFNCGTNKDEKKFRGDFCIECSNILDRNRYIMDKEKRAEKYRKKRNASDYFVYKFIDHKEQIVYIGKTIRLPARMVQHFKTDSHLTDECYAHVKSIFYSSLKTKAEMDIYELYLIDKYRPRYNTKSIYEKEKKSSIVLPELVWKEYQNECLKVKEKITISDKKTALMLEDVQIMVRALGDNLIDTRDRALMLIGFAGVFRRLELVAIMLEDIEFNPDGLTIAMQNGKTDQKGQGYKKDIPYGSNLDTCPVRSLQEWIRMAKITTGPLFRRVTKNDKVGVTALADKSVALIIKKLAKAAGLDENQYSGHSLRSGMTPTTFNRGL